MLAELKKELAQRADPAHKETLQRFFKTRPGEYGAGGRQGTRAA